MVTDEAPIPAYQVVVINGGSEILGLTYSAAKRNVKEKWFTTQQRVTQGVPSTPITFDDSDLVYVTGPHHDNCVIQIQIDSGTVHRVLIDGGNAVNILMLSTLKPMGIEEDRVLKKSTNLVGLVENPRAPQERFFHQCMQRV